jgi:hypothetical protein
VSAVFCVAHHTSERLEGEMELPVHRAAAVLSFPLLWALESSHCLGLLPRQELQPKLGVAFIHCFQLGHDGFVVPCVHYSQVGA